MGSSSGIVALPVPAGFLLSLVVHMTSFSYSISVLLFSICYQLGNPLLSLQWKYRKNQSVDLLNYHCPGSFYTGQLHWSLAFLGQTLIPASSNVSQVGASLTQNGKDVYVCVWCGGGRALMGITGTCLVPPFSNTFPRSLLYPKWRIWMKNIFFIGLWPEQFLLSLSIDTVGSVHWLGGQ